MASIVHSSVIRFCTFFVGEIPIHHIKSHSPNSATISPSFSHCLRRPWKWPTSKAGFMAIFTGTFGDFPIVRQRKNAAVYSCFIGGNDDFTTFLLGGFSVVFPTVFRELARHGHHLLRRFMSEYVNFNAIMSPEVLGLIFAGQRWRRYRIGNFNSWGTGNIIYN